MLPLLILKSLCEISGHFLFFFQDRTEFSFILCKVFLQSAKHKHRNESLITLEKEKNIMPSLATYRCRWCSKPLLFSFSWLQTCSTSLSWALSSSRLCSATWWPDFSTARAAWRSPRRSCHMITDMLHLPFIPPWQSATLCVCVYLEDLRVELCLQVTCLFCLHVDLKRFQSLIWDLCQGIKR